MKYVSFFLYYLKLRLGILFGVHHTANPVGVRWRWDHWQRRRRAARQDS